MLTAYIVCAAIGGMLVILSLLGGHHGGDAGHDVDHGMEHGLDHGAHELGHVHMSDADHGGAGDGDGMFGVKDFFSPLLSIRFWTYSLVAFGVGGMTLETVLKNPQLAFMLAIGTGLASGILAVSVFRAMRRGESNSSSDLRDLAGREVEVLVSVRPGQVGRVRCTAKGETLDLLAITDGEFVIENGTSAVIVGSDGDRVVVLPLDVALEEKGPQSLMNNQ